jgi:hypothetical protein
MKKQYNFSKAKRGPVLEVPRGKSRITIWLDDVVLDWFRKQVDEAGGGSYQNLINRALRAHIEQSDEPLVLRGASSQLGTRKVKTLPVLDVPRNFPRITNKRVRALLNEE